MKTNCSIKIVVIIDGELSEQDRLRVLDTLKKNLREYSFLGTPVEAELVG